MSGALMLMLDAVAPHYMTPIDIISANNSSFSAAPQSVSLQVTSNIFGSNKASVVLSASSAGATFVPASGVAPWYYPANELAPASIWVRWVSTSGDTPDVGQGVWYPIAGSSITYTWTQAAAGSKTCTGTLELSTDSGGVTIVASKTGIVISVNAT